MPDSEGPFRELLDSTNGVQLSADCRRSFEWFRLAAIGTMPPPGASAGVMAEDRHAVSSGSLHLATRTGTRSAALRTMLAGAALLAVVALLVGFVDRPAALFFKSLDDSAFAAVFRVITEFGRAEYYFALVGVVYAGSLALCLVYAPQAPAVVYRRIADMALYVFVALSLAGLALHAGKLLIGRSRPRDLFGSGIYDFTPFAFQQHLNSMPSGHSQAAWTAMTALALLAPRWRWWFVGIALAISMSRIFVSAHYASDVLVGSLLGAGVAWLVKHRLFPEIGTVDDLRRGA